MKATAEWLASTGATFSAGNGQSGIAHLTHYSAEYRVWGDGPPLVLLPGLAGGFELLGPIARILAANYRVISFQSRGENDCFALRRRFDLDDLVDDLSEFLDWHFLERPAVCGLSFGGVLGLEFAARYPSRLRALAIQGAGAKFERSLIKQVAGVVLSRYPLPSNNSFVNQFFNLLFGGRQKPGPLFDFVTGQCWQTDQSVIAHRFHLIEHFDMDGRLNRIRVPALIMAGDRDLLTSEKSLEELADGIAESERVKLRGCGHLAFVTHPELVASAIHQFLQRS